MSRGFKPPLFVAVLALAVLMVLLAFLQYQWLGRITEADRDRQRTRLTHGVLEFTQDVDRELTRAYLLFQAEPAEHEQEMAERFAERYDRWLATSRFPRLFDSFYVFTAIPSIEAGAAPPGSEPRLLRFDPSARGLIPTAWPDAMRDWRTHLLPGDISETAPGGTVVIRRMAAPTWPQVPAIVAPMPLTMMLLGDAPIERRIPSNFSYSILAIDVNYVSGELFPELTRRHFSGGESGLDFRVAVVSGDEGARVLYRSDPDFSPASGATVDAAADFFRVRAQDFAPLAAEVRRFSAFATAVHAPPGSTGGGRSVTRLEARPLSIVVQSGPGGTLPAGTSANVPVFAQRAAGGPAGWKLVLKHPSGSLDAAVDATRRKNLLVGSSILGILGTSMALLVLSTRRAQRLARQQMEFVATVSHELRTPLAVIRSAAENLADGVVQDETRVRRYGELVRAEGRRLTEMVEQVLEFAGIQSGQRNLALKPVAVEPLVREIVTSSAALIEQSGLSIELSFPPDLPPVLGDEPALGRVFRNLIGNAVKYGVVGGWVGVRARASASHVIVTVADRGIGIAPSDQGRIFEPFYRSADAVGAQIQGAGLGLSLVRRIVDAHGGRVLVTSAPGKGSEFAVHLPVAGIEGAVPAARSSPEPSGQGPAAARVT